ncbi:STAS domain-containing protein [Streptomyces lichenis]|uniref:STAS domain-containing protein n=1 Tax=Streptomyces lichenis TaxID=2306967 RepID=A0ABT0IA94_9ACTN|nr:STAS domain-containing protein [Streptomyces lichenis]MCK8678241.1 STAS domain-containing protein [Streptomyces lichenis]
MSTDLTVTVHDRDDRLVVITAAGALDYGTSGALLEQAATATSTHRSLALDLSGITFCDSSGLNALLRLNRHTGADGTALTLVAVPDQLRRLLRITGTDTVLTLRDNLTEL